MNLGSFDVSVVSDGEFRLDGGAMFGVVPRALWERVMPPDAHNRIRLTVNSLLISTGDDLLLVEAGVGDKHDAKRRQILGITPGATRLPESIRQAGYDLEEVTHVLLSHLHFDHCGWATRERNGRLVPTFPRARYWIQRGELEHARRPNARDRASYDPRNFEPLVEAGVVELFGEQAEPLPGVKAIRTPGHNADMCLVLVEGGPAEKLVFWADLVPTTAHLPYSWIMGYDLYPMQTLENKERWLPRAAAEGWLCAFCHDPDTPLARLSEEKPGRFRAEPVVTLAEPAVRDR